MNFKIIASRKSSGTQRPTAIVRSAGPQSPISRIIIPRLKEEKPTPIDSRYFLKALEQSPAGDRILLIQVLAEQCHVHISNLTILSRLVDHLSAIVDYWQEKKEVSSLPFDEMTRALLFIFGHHEKNKDKLATNLRMGIVFLQATLESLYKKESHTDGLLMRLAPQDAALFFGIYREFSGEAMVSDGSSTKLIR